MLKTLGAVVLGYAAIIAFTMISMTLAWFGTGPDFAFIEGTVDTSTGWALLSVLLGFLAGMFGGWSASFVKFEAVRILAVVVLLLGAVSIFLEQPPMELDKPIAELGVMEAATYAVQPIWYKYVIPVIGFLGVVIGGGLRRRPATHA